MQNNVLTIILLSKVIEIYSNLSNLDSVLLQAVGDGGALACEKIEQIARDADDLEITFPAYAALAAWGEEGLDLIGRIAMADHTVKSKSAAFTLFSQLSTNGKISLSESFFYVSGALAKAVNMKLEENSTRSDAKHALRNLVLSLPTDELLIPVSQSLMHHATFSPKVAQELVASLGVKWLHFGPSALKEYENLIVNRPNDEPAFQSFFCQFPQLLDPMAVEVWSEPDFHGALAPDFVIRRADGTYIVVEIECPAKLLVTRGGQLSAQATHAEKQTSEYENFLSERISEARTHFPKYSRADCLAVIGLESGLTQNQRNSLERVNRSRQNVRIVGFDWLLDRAVTLVNNVSQTNIEVHNSYRVI